MAEVAKIVVSIGGETYQLEQSVGKAKKEIGGLGDYAKRVGTMLLSYFAIDRLMSFAGSIITVRSEFEKYSAVLGNSLGSQKQAADAMGMLQKFAAQTPYQLTELTDSYVKLVNRGLKPSQQELTRVGDFASATGKSFGQLNEAILDANNPERWKEFGVQTKTMGDKVQLTFKGVTMEVERSAAGAMKAVEAFGRMEGVAGTMVVQMDTLGGKVSNLKDSWDMLLNNLGKSSAWKSAIGFISDAVSGLNLMISTKQKAEEFASKAGLSGIGGLEADLAKLSDITTSQTDQRIEELKKEAIATKNVALARQLLTEWANKYDDALDEISKKKVKTFDDASAIVYYKDLSATIDELLDKPNAIDKLLTPDLGKVSVTVGYIEGLKAKIKDLTDKMEKEPNVNLLAPIQLEINKTKQELDILMAKLADLSKGTIGKPQFEGSQFKSDKGTLTPMFEGSDFATKSNNLESMGMMFDPKQFGNFTKMASTKYRAFRDDMLDISDSLKEGMSDALGSLAEGIGEALATGNISSIFTNFIGTIGGFAVQLGKLMIAFGLSKIAFDKVFVHPAGAIAAGAALVVIGSAIKATMSAATGGASQTPNYGSQYGGQGRPTSENLTQHVEFDIRGDIIRALVRNDDKIVQRVR